MWKRYARSPHSHWILCVFFVAARADAGGAPTAWEWFSLEGPPLGATAAAVDPHDGSFWVGAGGELHQSHDGGAHWRCRLQAQSADGSADPTAASAGRGPRDSGPPGVTGWSDPDSSAPGVKLPNDPGLKGLDDREDLEPPATGAAERAAIDEDARAPAGIRRLAFQKDAVWVATSQGLFVARRGSAFVRAPLPGGSGVDDVRDVATRGAMVAVATARGLFVDLDGGGRFARAEGVPGSEAACCVVVDDVGGGVQIVVGTRAGVWRSRGGGAFQEILPSDGVPLHVTALAYDTSTFTLWVGSRRGLLAGLWGSIVLWPTPLPVVGTIRALAVVGEHRRSLLLAADDAVWRVATDRLLGGCADQAACTPEALRVATIDADALAPLPGKNAALVGTQRGLLILQSAARHSLQAQRIHADVVATAAPRLVDASGGAAVEAAVRASWAAWLPRLELRLRVDGRSSSVDARDHRGVTTTADLLHQQELLLLLGWSFAAPRTDLLAHEEVLQSTLRRRKALVVLRERLPRLEALARAEGTDATVRAQLQLLEADALFFAMTGVALDTAQDAHAVGAPFARGGPGDVDTKGSR